MVSKTYCDRCNTEIKNLADRFYVKVEGVKLGNLEGFSSAEICNKCKDEVTTFIKDKKEVKE